jgi:hypothetical protein
VNPLTSYLLAQGARRPLQTLRFCAAEVTRRSRLQRAVPANGAAFGDVSQLADRLRPFTPAGILGAPAPLPAAPELLAEANRICCGELEIFGRRVSFGLVPDWHSDWHTGHRWPLEHGVSPLDAPLGTDIKRPWEAARFHHGLRLAQGWRLTREPRYATAFAEYVSHWLQNNPYPRGIHWAMPMEVALRAINWISAAALLNDAPLPPAFWQRFIASLHLHGRHVYAHREWNPVARSNHYLACVVGILFCGVAVRDTTEGRHWLECARRALLEEMLAQVDADGVAHEGSSGYHLFVAELFLTGALALAQLDALEHGTNGSSPAPRGQLARACGEPFTARLERMFEFAAVLTLGRAAPPLWGDSDDGRVLPCCATTAHPAQHLLATAAALFGRADFAADHACSEPLWRLGVPAPALTPRASIAGKPQAAFPGAGFFFFSSARLHGSVRCGPLGVDGWANHAHCDQLSVELCCDGAPVLVDPGTYLYSGDPCARNALRSTRAHNTPMVEAAEQNRFWPGLLFRMMDDTRSRLLRCHSNDARYEFAGEHYGYRRLPQRVTVRRDLQLDCARHSLLISDTLTGSGVARVEWNFTLAPGLAPERLAADAPSPSLAPVPDEELTFHSAWRLGLLVMRLWTASGTPLASSIEPGWFAPRYGHRVPVSVLRLASSIALPLRVAFHVAPAVPTEKT